MSRLMPTEKKNTPSRSPLKGSIVASMARWYSVSASNSPATKAPSAIDRPAAAVASPLPTATNRAAATNSSVLSAEATSRNSGRRITVPTSTMAAMTRIACANASNRPPSNVPLFSGPRMVTRNNSGTTARSCNSRIAKHVRPVTVLSRCLRESTSITMAVEDSASEMPMSTAPPGRAPSRLAIRPINSAEIATCSVPSPNTRRRMVTSRLNDSSSPMRNNRNTTPRSAMAPKPPLVGDGDPADGGKAVPERAEAARARAAHRR